MLPYIIMTVLFTMFCTFGFDGKYWGIFIICSCFGFWFDVWYQKLKVLGFLEEYFRIEDTEMENDKNQILNDLFHWAKSQRSEKIHNERM